MNKTPTDLKVDLLCKNELVKEALKKINTINGNSLNRSRERERTRNEMFIEYCNIFDSNHKVEILECPPETLCCTLKDLPIVNLKQLKPGEQKKPCKFLWEKACLLYTSPSPRDA